MSPNFSQLGLRPRRLRIKRYHARFRAIMVNYYNNHSVSVILWYKSRFPKLFCLFWNGEFWYADKPSVFGWSSVALTCVTEIIRPSDRQVKSENVWSSIERKSRRNCLRDKCHFCGKLITLILVIRAVHNPHAMSSFRKFKDIRKMKLAETSNASIVTNFQLKRKSDKVLLEMSIPPTLKSRRREMWISCD